MSVQSTVGGVLAINQDLVNQNNELIRQIKDQSCLIAQLKDEILTLRYS